MGRHKGNVNCAVQLSKEMVATGSDDQTICIWDLNEHKMTTCLYSNQGPILSLCPLQSSPDSTSLVSFADHSTIASNSALRFNGSSRDRAIDPLFSEDLLVSGSMNGRLQVWQVGQEKPLKEVNCHSSGVVDIEVLSPQCIASIAKDSYVNIWDIENEIVTQLNSHVCSPSALTVHEDGTLLVGLTDGSVRIWDITTFSQIAVLNPVLSTEGIQVQCIKVLKDSKIVAGYSDGQLVIWGVNFNKYLN
ncbi:MAG: hypothetical protein S4CHLAM81_04690 [Chlamydiales bacterium]|nr:hypothetical protein [Chlamydiales bacterium]MCH9635258.1 hypothetical protein [Chlamydiales bacterium]